MISVCGPDAATSRRLLSSVRSLGPSGCIIRSDITKAGCASGRDRLVIKTCVKRHAGHDYARLRVGCNSIKRFRCSGVRVPDITTMAKYENRGVLLLWLILLRSGHPTLQLCAVLRVGSSYRSGQHHAHAVSAARRQSIVSPRCLEVAALASAMSLRDTVHKSALTGKIDGYRCPPRHRRKRQAARFPENRISIRPSGVRLMSK